jgi:hypothetical protein
MKKRIGIISMLLTALLIAGCSSGPMVYDKSVPLEKSSTLILRQCAITEFNGVKTGVSMNGLAGQKQVQIPAGKHRIQVHQKGGGVGYETWNTVDTTYDFLPGYIYVIFLGTVDMGSKLSIVGAPKFTGKVIQNELKPDPASPNASPIEGTWEYRKGNVFIFANNEFIWRFGGGNKFRGVFSIEENTITLPLFFEYKGGKWVEKFGGIFTMDYSGQEIKFVGKTLKKL